MKNTHGDADDEHGESENANEDAAEHAHHGHIHHEPGLGIEMISPHARTKLTLAIQPMMRYGYNSLSNIDDTMDMTVRRARVGFDSELRHGAGLHIELQAKNMQLGFADLYGRWALDEHIEVNAGFLGAPGGLERDTNPLDLPFLERSTLASMTHDRELGIELVGHRDGQFWALSVTRDAPLGVGGDDPDFTPVLPPGVNLDVLNRSTTRWNQAARIGVAPSDEFATSIGWSLRFRPNDPDYGDPVFEPNGSIYVDPHPYEGTSVRIGADAARSQDHFRMLVEAAYRRDGTQLQIDPANGAQTDLDGHLWWTAGYLTIGWTPDGRYGRAVDGAPLQYGWELVARFEASKVKPVDAFGATFFNATLGWNWQATPQVRIQAEANFEAFGQFDQTLAMDNADAKRFYAQLWAIWRL